MKELDLLFGTKLVMKVANQRKDKLVSIEIQSNCKVHFICATAALSEVLNVDRIDCKASKTLDNSVDRSIESGSSGHRKRYWNCDKTRPREPSCGNTWKRS